MGSLLDPAGNQLNDPSGAALSDPGGPGGTSLGRTHAQGHAGALGVPHRPALARTHASAHTLALRFVEAHTPALSVLRSAGRVLAFAAPTHQTVTLAPAVSGPVAYGPAVAFGDTVPPDLAVRLFRLSDLATPVATFADAFGVQWQDIVGEAGHGTVQLLNVDPALPAWQDDLVVRIDVCGNAAFSFLVREREHVAVADSEEAGQVTTLSGPGLLDMFASMLVWPSRGVDAQPRETKRTFGWMSFDYDDSAWGTATEVVKVTDPSPGWGGVRVSDQSWPVPLMWWVWDRAGASTWAPGGDVYFRQQFYMGAGGGTVHAYVAADDYGVAYLDSQLVWQTDEFADDVSNVDAVVMELGEGWHTIAAKVTNTPGDAVYAGAPYNPAGFACMVVHVDAFSEEQPDTGLYLWTDHNWKMLAYPSSPPGMTVGEVVRHVLAEAYFRGGHYTELTFTDDVDSAGAPWPGVVEISTQVGRDVLTFLRELAATYVDFEMDASGRLHLWAKGTRADAAPKLALHGPTDPTDPGTSNLVGLTHKRAG